MCLEERGWCKHASYKLEADFMADPFWCKDCGENLEIEEFPISTELQTELMEWVTEYGQWIDLETDTLRDNGVKLEEWHNKTGLRLFQEVKKQLGDTYPLTFVPSNSATLYSKS